MMRMFMRHHNMWNPGPCRCGPLRSVSGPVGPELCTILDTDFRELYFSEGG
jgi:hypothetical protein